MIAILTVSNFYEISLSVLALVSSEIYLLRSHGEWRDLQNIVFHQKIKAGLRETDNTRRR